MITAQKIIDRVNELILEQYPDSTFHIQNIPKGFKRPSFFIELVTDSFEDASHSTTDDEISIEIVYFAPTNDYNIPDGLNQLEVLNSLKNIFKKSYISVEDRSIKVTYANGSPRDNEVYYSVTFQFTESKPQNEDIYEFMGEINIKLGGGN